jgi:hypothetical protein
MVRAEPFPNSPTFTNARWTRRASGSRPNQPSRDDRNFGHQTTPSPARFVLFPALLRKDVQLCFIQQSALASINVGKREEL